MPFGESKPALLLDIDGVLCPFGWTEVPSGYAAPENLYDLAVVVSEANTDRLRNLQEDFDLVWATAWEGEANDVIGPFHELVPLPFIEFGTQRGPDGRIHLPPSVDLISHRSGSSSWKLPWIAAWADSTEKPLAWVDDDIAEDAFEWAEARSETIPTAVVPINCAEGLTDKAVTLLQEFARVIRVLREAADGSSVPDG